MTDIDFEQKEPENPFIKSFRALFLSGIYPFLRMYFLIVTERRYSVIKSYIFCGSVHPNERSICEE